MKISARIEMIERNVFQELPFGVIVLNKENDILKMNTYILNILKKFGINTKVTKIEAVLKSPLIEEMKQSHTKKEKIDHLLETNQKVITTYLPLLKEDETFQGVIIFVELLSDLKQHAYEYTDYGIYQELLSSIQQEKSNLFRVVLDNGEEWMSTNSWKDQWKSFSKEKKMEMNKQTLETIANRKKMKKNILNRKNSVLSPITLIAKPLLVKGKLIGCLQLLHMEIEEYFENELKQLRSMIRKIEKTNELDDLVGETFEMKMALEQAKLYKDKDNVVLINGEIGTGKATLARAIHMESKRSNKPFVTLHSNTLESDQHVEKAFDYIREKAHNGTAYILLQQPVSSKIDNYLLEFIHDCKTTRFIFGKIANPEQEDLPSNLIRKVQQYQITLPALRERKEDISLIAERLLFYFNEKYHMYIDEIDQDVLNYWKNKEWPHNISQLEQELEAIIEKCDIFTDTITTDHINERQENNRKLNSEKEKVSLQLALDQFEKEYIKNALRANQYNKTKTAKALNVSVRNLYYKMDKYNMDRGAP